jgi:hypothetical protein
VRLAQDTLNLGRIGPEEMRSMQRSIAAITTETTVEVPSVTLQVDGLKVDKLPSKHITPVQQGVLIRGSVTQGKDTCDITIENNTTESKQITGLEVRGQELLNASVHLESGEMTEFSGHLRDVGDGPARCTVTFADEATANALLVPQAKEADDGSDGVPFDSAIGTETEVAGDYGTVVLEFWNDSEARLTDVNLTAEGESINDMLYSPAIRDSLEPGERIEHFVDLKTTAGEVSMEITATCTADGDTRSFRYQAQGPAVSVEDEWTDDHRSAWTLEVLTDDHAQQDQLPAEVMTAYEPAKENDADNYGLGDMSR